MNKTRNQVIYPWADWSYFNR